MSRGRAKQSQGPIATLGKYPSRSNPTKTYTVVMAEDESVYCDCPAWKFQRIPPADRTCKHIKLWKAGDLGVL